MIFAALMLATAAVPGPETSPLLEERHSHEWAEVYADDEWTVWIDPSWEAARDVDGVELPIVLMRKEMTLDGGPPLIADVAMAVDCKSNQMGMAGIWADHTESEVMIEGPNWFEYIAMDYVQKPLGDEDIAIFQFVCGSTWQP